MSRTKRESTMEQGQVVEQQIPSQEIAAAQDEQEGQSLGTITLSVGEKVAQLGQQQLAITGIESLKGRAGMPAGARLGRKSGTMSLVIEARSAAGKALRLVVSDGHAVWVQHQALGADRDQLADLWKHLANGHAGRSKVTLSVISVEAHSNGGETLSEIAW